MDQRTLNRAREYIEANLDEPFLVQIINLKHALVVLADKIDWVWLDAQLTGSGDQLYRCARPPSPWQIPRRKSKD